MYEYGDEGIIDVPRNVLPVAVLKFEVPPMRLDVSNRFVFNFSQQCSYKLNTV